MLKLLIPMHTLWDSEADSVEESTPGFVARHVGEGCAASPSQSIKFLYSFDAGCILITPAAADWNNVFIYIARLCPVK